MSLLQPEKERFFSIMFPLLWSVNEMHDIVPEFAPSGEIIVSILRQMWENPEWMDAVIDGTFPSGLGAEERAVIADWREHFVKGRFYIMRHTAKYTVMMSSEEEPKLYGVCGLSAPIWESLPMPPPILADAVLLPFRGKLVYDGMLYPANITFGKTIRASLTDTYNRIRENVGVIEAFGVPPVPKPARKKPKPPVPASAPQDVATVDTKGANVPKAMAARYAEIAGIIEGFCLTKLNTEYNALCLRALAKLCRKRPSPVAAGRARTWACGIVYAIASCNGIFNRTTNMHMSAEELAKGFGLAKSTAYNQSTAVTDLLELSRWNNGYLLKRRHGILR